MMMEVVVAAHPQEVVVEWHMPWVVCCWRQEVGGSDDGALVTGGGVGSLEAGGKDDSSLVAGDGDGGDSLDAGGSLNGWWLLKCSKIIFRLKYLKNFRWETT